MAAVAFCGECIYAYPPHLRWLRRICETRQCAPTHYTPGVIVVFSLCRAPESPRVEIRISPQPTEETCSNVFLFCFVTVYGKTPEYNSYYKPNVGLDFKDARGQPSNIKSGFVQPLDFSSFTQQFVGEEKAGESVTFGRPKTSPVFGAESKKSGAFQIPSSEFAPFQNPIFSRDANKTEFVQSVQFANSFNKGANTRVYKTNINPSHKTSELNVSDQIPKPTEEEEQEDEDSYFKSSKTQNYRQPVKPKKPYTYGKSSYSSLNKKSSPSDYYSSLISKPKDVEMILPKDKVLFLPMVNGRPKPYDGYRAAPESSYETFESDEDKESTQQREKRLNEGEIIYGKPKIALSELYHRQLKRSPAEYYGGIYPYYDYSDAKLSVGGDTDPDSENRGKKSAASNQKGKKAYPKKQSQWSADNPYNPYKYPKDSTKKRNKDDDTLGYASGESSEEREEDSEEESEETKTDRPIYKYTYDDTVRVPPLEIKTYPYEKHLKDSKVEGTKRDESIDYDDNVDEYTAGYEKYIRTLPSDLETYFGSSEISDKFSVEATQNLENNKNCKKIDDIPAKTEEGFEKSKSEDEAETQVCYICSDPKTGDNYEQCAYRSKPKTQKYFFGGTTSFQTNETAEPTTYRYKRSAYDPSYFFNPYALKTSESTENLQYREPEDSEDIYKKPKKKYKKKYKKQSGLASTLYGKKLPKKRYEEYEEYNPFFKLHGAYSTKRGRAAKLEKPPKSYNGPKYTYEGPEETYEGPARTYEGPKETYEGPAEPYEGPINQEYYDTVDERIRDDDEEEEESPKQESQSSSPKKSRYYTQYKRQKPKKRQSYSSRYGSPYASSSYYDDDYEDSFRPHGEYTSDYRFGPEHFVDEEEPENTKQNHQIKPTAAPKASEKRGPQKFSGSEARSAVATDKEEKEEPIGEVKTFKNGDVCQKKRKEGMICMVCKNEKTAATYEQCQYSTKPKEKYYAYGSQKSYTSKNPNDEQKEDESYSDSDSDQFPEKSDIVEKKILITTQSKIFGYDPAPAEGLIVAESNNSPRILPKDVYGDYTDNIETLSDDPNQNDTSSRDFKESIERIEPRDGIEGLEEYLYDVEDSEKKATEDEKQSYKTYDDYFHDLFPEFAKSSEPVPESDEKEESESETQLSFDPFSNVRKFHEENNRPERYSREEEEEEEEKDAEASRPEELRLKDRESRIPRDFFIPYNEEDHKKDLEKALGEFQNKDWSNCKKIVKKKLTCYQCVDENGVNNEECMYVEASQPISKHLAYHEKKELRAPGQEIKNKTFGPATEVTEPENEKSLRRFRKDKNSPAEIIEVAGAPNDAEYVEKSTKKGDFEGAEKLQETKIIENPEQQETSEVIPEQSSPKPKAKKNKRNPKKRNKTIRNETTTERFEKIRKRKFPVKKFTEKEELPEENKPEEVSFELEKSELAPAKFKINETETSR